MEIGLTESGEKKTSILMNRITHLKEKDGTLLNNMNSNNQPL